MSFWNSKEIKKTKKTHYCEYCLTDIPVESHCCNEVGTFEGEFNNYYLCDRCRMFIDHFVYFGSGDALGSFDDELRDTDLLDCPKCKSSNSNSEYCDDGTSREMECNNCDNVWTVDLSLDGMAKIIETLKEVEDK